MLLKKMVAGNYCCPGICLHCPRRHFLTVTWDANTYFFQIIFCWSDAKLWLTWGVESCPRISPVALIVHFHPYMRQACSSCPGLLQSRASESSLPKCTSKFNQFVHFFLFFWACMSCELSWLTYSSKTIPYPSIFYVYEKEWKSWIRFQGIMYIN